MVIQTVESSNFGKYGRVLEGYQFQDFLQALSGTPMPEDGVIYLASDPELERQSVFTELQNRAFGGMPLQIGYCNGKNTKLNCLEYHKASEVCVMLSDTILLIGLESDIVDWQYDTSKVEAFLIPGGQAVEVFATTLHYAPCSAKPGEGYKVAICLPRGTNGPRPEFVANAGEDNLMTGCNKWLLAHKDSDEAKQGAHIGLFGENIDIYNDIV